MFFCHIISILIFFMCLIAPIAECQTITSDKGEFDVSTLLGAFCRQKHRLDVIECVNYSSQGQALKPWNDCLNPDKDLNKQEVANLACRLLDPEFKVVLNVLADCVERLVDFSDAVVWMSILQTCAHKTSAAGGSDILSGNTVRSA